ncbi:MAG: 16S rRNA (uracil(1498)-N(3))-methyltransferase [Pseudomonadales bacterium]|nr:16S rRNA (uracil(1498)-N(3))-methyltransferase [Pseudomonadales bacterium]
MRTPRVYTVLELTIGSSVHLETAVSRYLLQSLRQAKGASIELFNGDGYRYSATIIESTKSSVTAQIDSKQTGSNESPLKIHIGLALSRGERMDYGIRKIVEMGGNSITPLITQRCEVRLSKERMEKRIKHWQGIIISACEQCGRNTIPALHEPVKLNSWLGAVDDPVRLIFHPSGGTKLADRPKPKSVALLVGPEGGFDNEEVAQAQQQGFDSITLGPRILRTETAPIAAISVLQYLWGDFDG